MSEGKPYQHKKNENVSKKTHFQKESPLCLKNMFQVLPLEGSPIFLAAGSYEFVKSLSSFGESDFLAEVNKFLAFQKLKPTDKGTGTTLIISDDKGAPFALFKPSAFSSSSKDNPQQTNVLLNAYDSKQASVSEVATSFIQSQINNEEELQSHFVEINLDGKVLQGTLQRYLAHSQSVDDLIFVSGNKSLNDFFMAGVLHFEPSLERLNMASDTPKERLLGLAHSSCPARYTINKRLKDYYAYIKKIPSKQIHQTGLLDLMCGNMDSNPSNLLLVEGSDEELQLIPVDFDQAFVKEKNAPWANLQISFWYTHPSIYQPIDAELEEYFKNIDINAMVGQLQASGMELERLTNFKIRALIIKEAILKNIPVFEIANLFIPKKISTHGSGYEATTHDNLSYKFFQRFDNSRTQTEKNEAWNLFGKELEVELDELATRLQNPKSFESQLRNTGILVPNSNSLSDYNKHYRNLRKIRGLDHRYPHFRYATPEEIKSNDQSS